MPSVSHKNLSFGGDLLAIDGKDDSGIPTAIYRHNLHTEFHSSYNLYILGFLSHATCSAGIFTYSQKVIGVHIKKHLWPGGWFQNLKPPVIECMSFTICARMWKRVLQLPQLKAKCEQYVVL